MNVASSIIDPESQQSIVNHCRANQLLEYCRRHLQKIFHERWKIYCSLNVAIKPWSNNEASGKKLVKFCVGISKEMKNALESGNADLWDITATNRAIQAVSNEIKKYGVCIDKSEDNLINDLREIRNKIAHIPKFKLTDDEFAELSNQMEDILIKFGDSAEEINKFKEALNELGQTKNMDDINSKFSMLKEKANKLFKDGNYSEAIKAYDEILQLPNTLPENKAIVFSNRCAAYLKLADDKSLKMAKRDAECALQSWPSWWRGYYRMGCVHAKLREYNEALENLETALALNPNSKEAMDEISDVRKEYGIISREEHLRPAHQPKSYDSEEKEACKKLGISKDEYEKLLKLSADTPMADVIKGYRFKDEGDYTKAAACYAKAAKAGYPAGMYNLALLYESGKGVERDFDECLRWLRKAADGKALIMIGSGVPEAQHSLGIEYERGIGVHRNYKTAAEWYEKAVANKFPPSANNLGLLYKNGLGVERSLEKAFHYFKIAAKGGDTPSMNNLAQCYFSAEGTGSTIATKDDIEEGMKWLKIATEKGDMVAERELERRQNLTKEEIAAKNGSFTAQRQLNIWDYLNVAIEAFKNNDTVNLFGALAKAIRLDHQIVNVPEIFHQAILDGIKADPNNLDVITCYVRMNSKKPFFLLDYIQNYQNEFQCFDEYGVEISIACFIIIKDFDRAIALSDFALEVCPQSLRFLYVRALSLSMHSNPTDECIKALDAFLAVAPKDHDIVPACHYRKASYFFTRNQITQFKASMKAGINAEKDQLPCFMPYQFPSKDMLMKIYSLGGVSQFFNSIKNIYFNS